MVYDRYPRSDRSGDYQGNPGDSDLTRDYDTRRNFTYLSARDDRAAGDFDRDRDDNREPYGDRGTYGDRNTYGERDYRPREYGYGGYAQRNRTSVSDPYRSDYAGRTGGGYPSPRAGDEDRQPESNRAPSRSGSGNVQDRGFFDRAGDEVRSWFGDEDAERRREMDARRDARYGTNARDEDYHSWRRGQIDALDRDYDEYRRENRTKFENEFGSWRSERQTQRGSLSSVKEHMDVIGSDGGHVGTVDKVRGDRIILTKGDSDADGRHHSIPSRWLHSIDDKVTLRKTADEAHAHWRDEERNQAMFGDDRDRGLTDTDGKGRILNRSFSGTY